MVNPFVITPGSPRPLGATFDGAGVNFALFSAHATRVDLCLFDSPDALVEHTRLSLPGRSDAVWHGYVPHLAPGQLYGYRVFGPWEPAAGHRFDPTKVLLDPYARRLGRPLRWNAVLLGSRTEGEPDARSTTDTAPFAPLAAVPDLSAAEAFNWRGDTPPGVAWRDTLIYELHVKGFSALNPDVPPRERGTYLGVVADASLRHLTTLGVTAVELMPIHERSDEWRLVQLGLVNYWGYNTLAFFVPDHRFATGGAPERAADEFKTMVRELHAAGIEVILDVVYNHTSEGDETGPTLSLRGIDNASYYRLDPQRPGGYQNFAGTGNTLDLRSPAAAALVKDSLRYWVEEMHVDGFRFDLATVLARQSDAVDTLSGFCADLTTDPVLSRVKLIAEPWDVGPDGYHVGNFPPGWREWNDRYRNGVRRFWRGERGMLPDLSTRLAGSSDLYRDRFPRREPTASVNAITTHDGFTLADLVAYDERHNEANGEHNLDGERHNFSWNSGVEGETDDPSVLALRERRRRSLFLTLMVSLGVPMISGGDELGRTQRGNNNAYCHDSELTWTPWPLDEGTRDFLAFARCAAALRRSHPVFRRDEFLQGRVGDRADVLWLTPDGREMQPPDWANAEGQSLGVLLDGRDAGDGLLLVLLNASWQDVSFVLPDADTSAGWRVLVDTARRTADQARCCEGPTFLLPMHSAAVLARKGAHAMGRGERT
jgi:glycogen operon protein